MTNQERLLIEALFKHMQVSGLPRDPEAEALIAEQIAQPGAAYALAQTVLIQNQELAAAEARIVNLEAKLSTLNGTAVKSAARRDLLRTVGGMEKAGAGFMATAALATMAVAGV